MTESVILGDPAILIGLIAALVLAAAAAFKKVHFVASLLAITLFACTMSYALLKGADLYEAGAAAAVFFIVTLIPLGKKGGSK